MNPIYPWLDTLSAMLKTDETYQQRLAVMLEREADFLALKEKLTPEEWDALSLYIAACEELNYAMIFPAYTLGCRQSKCNTTNNT